MTEKNTPEEIISNEPRSIREIVKDLSKPIAQKHLRKRRQGGKEIIYLAWHDAVKYLDHFAPGWCYEIRSIESVAGKLIMVVRTRYLCGLRAISGKRRAESCADFKLEM